MSNGYDSGVSPASRDIHPITLRHRWSSGERARTRLICSQASGDQLIGAAAQIGSFWSA